MQRREREPQAAQKISQALFQHLDVEDLVEQALKIALSMTHDMIALPLKQWDGDPIGVLEVINEKTGKLDVVDVTILNIISAFTAIAISQAHLHEEAKLAEGVRVLGDIGHDVKNLLMPLLCGATLLSKG